MRKHRNKKHIYPRLRYNRKEVEVQYQDGLAMFNSWSQEERVRRGFGVNGHAHPRRFYIFLQKYFTEIRYFMNEKERSEFVFPWVCATRSERMKAIAISKVYFSIKKTALKLAQKKYIIYKLNREIEKLKTK